MACLYPDRVFLGVGTGEALNEIATGYIGEWPEFKERFARLRESVRLMRELWRGDRVDFDGDYYHLKGASIYDVPEGGVPVYIAAGGPAVAKYAGRAGDGFICTSGKGEELYTEKLLPAVIEGAAAAERDVDDDRQDDRDQDLLRHRSRTGAGEYAVLGAAVTDRRAEAQHPRPDGDGEGRQRAAHRAGRQALDRLVRSRRGRREGRRLRRASGSTTWCSTLPATISGGSWSCSKGSGAAAAQTGLISGLDYGCCRRDRSHPTVDLRRLPRRRHRQVHRRAGHPAPADRDGAQGRASSGPITRREDRDYILELLLAHSNAGLSYEDCVGVSYQRLHEDPDGGDRRHRRPLPRDGGPLRRRGDRRLATTPTSPPPPS